MLLLDIVGASVGRMDKMAVDSRVPSDPPRAVLISTIEQSVAGYELGRFCGALVALWRG